MCHFSQAICRLISLKKCKNCCQTQQPWLNQWLNFGSVVVWFSDQWQSRECMGNSCFYSFNFFVISIQCATQLCSHIYFRVEIVWSLKAWSERIIQPFGFGLTYFYFMISVPGSDSRKQKQRVGYPHRVTLNFGRLSLIFRAFGIS